MQKLEHSIQGSTKLDQVKLDRSLAGPWARVTRTDSSEFLEIGWILNYVRLELRNFQKSILIYAIRKSFQELLWKCKSI